jgi:hypothetical protein
VRCREAGFHAATPRDCIAHVEPDGAPRDIDFDGVGVFHQRERTAFGRFGPGRKNLTG